MKWSEFVVKFGSRYSLKDPLLSDMKSNFWQCFKKLPQKIKVVLHYMTTTYQGHNYGIFIFQPIQWKVVLVSIEDFWKCNYYLCKKHQTLPLIIIYGVCIYAQITWKHLWEILSETACSRYNLLGDGSEVYNWISQLSSLEKIIKFENIVVCLLGYRDFRTQTG